MSTDVVAPVLFQSPDLIAVSKPAGVTVIPARDEPANACLRAALESARGERLFVVHRLDRDTSGVVLFARNAGAHRALSLAFESRRVRKLYLAYTRGAPPALAGVIDAALHPARKGKMRPAAPGEPGAQPSTTSYAVRALWETNAGTVARVEAEPRTGRQHQIRVHLRSVGAPLLVDPLYGRCEALAPGALGPGSPAVTRLTLHALGIDLADALPDGPRIEAPVPSDLAALEAWLHTCPAAPRAQS